METTWKQGVSVRDIMTREVVSVRLKTPLTEAAKILAEHDFDGVPVVDEAETLIGILTEYDLISKGSAVHIPTLQMIIKQLPVLPKDMSAFRDDVKAVAALTVRDVMNDDPLTLPESATFEDAVMAFRDHHRVNPIPIVDQNRRVVGIITRFDILKPFRDLSASGGIAPNPPNYTSNYS